MGRSRKGWPPLCACACWAIGAPAFAEDAATSPPAKDAPSAFNAKEPTPKSGWGIGDGRSWWIPAADIVGFQILLNQIDRHTQSGDDYDSNWSTIKHNFKGHWVYDNDPFSINQFGHPYQGATYFGLTRSAGLGFWPSLGYTTAASALWEIAGEKTEPSQNDQYTTTFAGGFLGEALFRMSSLLLETSGGAPGFWREAGAAAIAPGNGFNRYAYGDRFDGVFRSHDPAVYTRMQLGANVNASVHSDVNRNRDPEGASVPQDFRRGEGTADFNVIYGIPGKDGYTYHRPFDYFDFQLTAVTSNALESVITHGMLFGTDYAVGDKARGIWGLYGTYDYLAPQIFRVSTTGFALGTTGQWWIGHETALQGSALAGAGYGSAGTIKGRGDRDYHNGIAPQGHLTMRVIFGDTAALEVTGRDYYVTDHASEESGGTENIVRADVSLTWRVYRLHGLTLKYVFSSRDAQYNDLPDTKQRVSAISIGYTYLGHARFGAVEWRPDRVSGS